MQGFAVLQVNVRNSWGFGKEGREMSDNNWIGALQEDLDDAVQELIAKKIVNSSRVTLFGNGFGGVLALQMAARSKCFSAVATINLPAEISRYDLASLSTETEAEPLMARLGGWRAAGKYAKELSPILVAPTLVMPALYLHEEDSIKGRPIEDGRDIRAAVKKTKAVAQFDLAYSWSRTPKPPSIKAREEAEISMKIATFFDQVATASSK